MKKDQNIYEDQMIHPEAVKRNPQTTTYQVNIARSKKISQVILTNQ